MVGTKKIKSLDFDTIEQYFEYIVLSEVNGNRLQVYNLINDLSNSQKKECLKYINNYECGSDAEIVKNILIQSL